MLSGQRVQQALNVRQGSTDSEIEVCMHMHSLLVKMLQKVKEGKADAVDWREIQRAALHQNPPCAEWVDQLSMFVRDFSGHGEVLLDLANFVKASSLPTSICLQ